MDVVMLGTMSRILQRILLTLAIITVMPILVLMFAWVTINFTKLMIVVLAIIVIGGIYSITDELI